MIQTVSLSQIVPIRQMESNPAADKTPAQLTRSFGAYLQRSLEGLEAQQVNVHKLNDTYMAGQIDVTEVLIASEQAQLSLQLTAQVRNKIVEAYQDIMRMQI